MLRQEPLNRIHDQLTLRHAFPALPPVERGIGHTKMVSAGFFRPAQAFAQRLEPLKALPNLNSLVIHHTQRLQQM